MLGDELDDLLEDIEYVQDGEDEDVEGLVKEERSDCAREEKKKKGMKKRGTNAFSSSSSSSSSQPPIPSLSAPIAVTVSSLISSDTSVHFLLPHCVIVAFSSHFLFIRPVVNLSGTAGICGSGRVDGEGEGIAGSAASSPPSD